MSTPLEKKYVEHPFEEIYENLYVSVEKPTNKVTSFDQCSCLKRGYRCENDECENRCSKYECSKETCPCGAQCQNQKLQTHGNADVYVFDAGNSGKGLKTRRDLPAGTFIMEYVGEIIDWNEYGDRDEKYKNEGLVHRYFLLLDSEPDTDEYNIYIDSQKKANMTRYINHSCDPNCHMEKWNVGKEYRMAVYTNKAVAKGTELTFDYKWEAMGAESKIKCYCGSENCRGFVDYVKNKRVSKITSSATKNRREETYSRMTEEDIYDLREQNKKEHVIYRFPNAEEKEAGVEIVGAKVRMYYDDQKCYFNGEIIDFKMDPVTRKPMHKISFLFDGEQSWFDLRQAEKGNWQVLKNFKLNQPSARKAREGDNKVITGITLRNFPSCKVKDLKNTFNEAIRQYFAKKILNPRHVKIEYYADNLNSNSSEDMEVEPMCLVTYNEQKTSNTVFDWSHDVRVQFRNKRVLGRELKAIGEDERGVRGIRSNRELLPFWPPIKQEAVKDEMEDDEEDLAEETKRQLQFPFRLNWNSKKEVKLRETRRDRIVNTIKDYLRCLQNEENVVEKAGWGGVYTTAMLTCLRYLTVLEMEDKTVDTSQLAIASLIVTLKYLGLFEPTTMWDLIFTKFLELGSSNAVNNNDIGDDDSSTNQMNIERKKKKQELRHLEKHLAQVIWFDIASPYVLLHDILEDGLSADISAGDMKLLSNVSKEIIRHTIMDSVWVQNTINLVVASIVIIAAGIVTKVNEGVSLPLDDKTFSYFFLSAIGNNAKKVRKVMEILALSSGALKSLEKFAKKKKSVDITAESFKSHMESKYAIEKLSSQWISNTNQIPTGSSLALVPDMILPRANKVMVIQKSMGSEQRGHCGLWTNATGADSAALHELYTLRRLHHPIRNPNIWIPSKIAKREINKSSSDDANADVVSQGGDENENSYQYCMYADKLGENLVAFLKKNKNVSLETLLNIAKQIVAAVRHCCTQKNVLHGQLSPVNVYVVKVDGNYNVSLKGFGGSVFYNRKDHMTALELQWNKYDGWRRDRKKLEAKRSETDDKKKQKILKKEIFEIYLKSKQAMAVVLKKLKSLPSHVLPHMAPELLMGSGVYSETCEAWSLGSILFFLFSRGKLFAGVSKDKSKSNSSSSSSSSHVDGDEIDKTRRDILNTIFGRCSRSKLPKEMRSYPGRMNVSEKADDGNKHLQRVISWLSKGGSTGDDPKTVEKIGKAIYGLLKVAPRERTKLRRIVKDELFYSEGDDDVEQAAIKPPVKRWVSAPVESSPMAKTVTTTTTNVDNQNHGYGLPSTNYNHGYNDVSVRHDQYNSHNKSNNNNYYDDSSSRKRRWNDGNDNDRRSVDYNSDNNKRQRWQEENVERRWG